MRRLVLLITAGTLLSPDMASAQLGWMPHPGLSVITQEVGWRGFHDSVVNQDPDEDADEAEDGVAPAPAAPRVAAMVRAVRSPVRIEPTARTRTFDAHLAEMRKIDAAGAETIAGMLRSGELQSGMSAAMRSRGLTPDALPDVMAVYWLVGWYAAQGRDAEAITPVQAQAVRDQLAVTLATKTGVPQATAVQKQQLVDGMFMETMKLDALSTLVARGEVPVAKVRDAAERSLSSVGLTLKGVRLTDEGFVPAGGASLDEPATTPAAQPTRMAATPTPTPLPDAATGTPPWLWALGGAAGMGAGVLGLRRLRG